jgi:hypothetical protein
LTLPGECVSAAPLDKGPIDGWQQWPPGQLKLAQNSLQYNGALSSLNEKLKTMYTIVYYAGVLIMLFFISPFFVCKTRNPKHYSFAVFAITVILVNACIMPSFIGIVLSIN